MIGGFGRVDWLTVPQLKKDSHYLACAFDTFLCWGGRVWMCVL